VIAQGFMPPLDERLDHLVSGPGGESASQNPLAWTQVPTVAKVKL
jgi:hypothetical protein